MDTGRGVTMRLAALQRRPSRIDAVFLTHLHSDHTADLPDLFATTWDMGRSKPLDLYGPQGVVELAEGVKQFLAEDIHIRRDLTEMLPAAGAQIKPHVVQPGVAMKSKKKAAPKKRGFKKSFPLIGSRAILVIQCLRLPGCRP